MFIHRETFKTQQSWALGSDWDIELGDLERSPSALIILQFQNEILLLPKKNSCLSEVVVISVVYIKFQLSFASEGLDDVVLDHQKKDVCLQTYFSSLTCNPHWGKKVFFHFTAAFAKYHLLPYVWYCYF